MSGQNQTKVLGALKSGACLTLDELSNCTGFTKHQISVTVARLIERRLVERIAIGSYQASASGLNHLRAGNKITSGPRRSYTGRRLSDATTFRQRVWKLIRLNQEFTISRLMSAVECENMHECRLAVERYVRYLRQGGYLHPRRIREPGTRPGSHGFRVWELVRDTGEKAPSVIQKGKALYDHNLGKTFSFTDQKEAA